MTAQILQAQLLQAQIMNEFFMKLTNPLSVYTDSELKQLEWIAVEENDGKKIRAIREEYARRHREQ